MARQNKTAIAGIRPYFADAAQLRETDEFGTFIFETAISPIGMAEAISGQGMSFLPYDGKRL